MKYILLTLAISLTCGEVAARSPKTDFLNKIQFAEYGFFDGCTIGMSETKDPRWRKLSKEADCVKDLESQVNSLIETYPVTPGITNVVCVTLTSDGKLEKPFLMAGGDYRLATQIAKRCTFRPDEKYNFRHAAIEIHGSKFACVVCNANPLKDRDGYFDTLRNSIIMKNPKMYQSAIKADRANQRNTAN